MLLQRNQYKLSEEKCGTVYQDPFFKFLFPSIRMAKIQMNNSTNCLQGCKATGTLTASENAKWCSHSGKEFGNFL